MVEALRPIFVGPVRLVVGRDVGSIVIDLRGFPPLPDTFLLNLLGLGQQIEAPISYADCEALAAFFGNMAALAKGRAP